VVRLRANPDQTVAQPPLERAETLPFEPVDWIAGRMRLRDRVAGQTLAPGIVVTLAAGEVELALPPIERGAAVVEKRLHATVDRDVDRQAAGRGRPQPRHRRGGPALVGGG